MLKPNMSPLERAFRRTDYWIAPPKAAPIRLRIGEASPAYDAWAAKNAIRWLHLVTAWNPVGMKRRHGANIAANKRLEALLDIGRVRYVPSQSRGWRGDWPEPGFALANMEIMDAFRLAEAFGQAALLMAEPKRKPVLLMIRDQ